MRRRGLATSGVRWTSGRFEAEGGIGVVALEYYGFTLESLSSGQRVLRIYIGGCTFTILRLCKGVAMHTNRGVGRVIGEHKGRLAV